MYIVGHWAPLKLEVKWPWIGTLDLVFSYHSFDLTVVCFWVFESIFLQFLPLMLSFKSLVCEFLFYFECCLPESCFALFSHCYFLSSCLVLDPGCMLIIAILFPADQYIMTYSKLKTEKHHTCQNIVLTSRVLNIFWDKRCQWILNKCLLNLNDWKSADCFRNHSFKMLKCMCATDVCWWCHEESTLTHNDMWRVVTSVAFFVASLLV